MGLVFVKPAFISRCAPVMFSSWLITKTGLEEDLYLYYHSSVLLELS